MGEGKYLDFGYLGLKIFLAEEIKRRIKVIEVFPDEGSAERLLYLILKEMNERLNSRKLRKFNEIKLVKHYALLDRFFIV